MIVESDPPDDDWARTVCKTGQGAECCRYLVMAPNGWSCAKHTGLKAYLDRRVVTNTIRAQGDNCLGRGAR
jgi:hypothetical protein